MRLIFPTVLALVGTACGTWTTSSVTESSSSTTAVGGVDCDGMAMVSVIVTVTDEATGAPMNDADVRWIADEGGGDCESVSNGQYNCAYGVAGAIEIWVERDGYDYAEVLVNVERGMCNVVTEELAVALPPSEWECTDDGMNPSLEIHVFGVGDTPAPYGIDDAVVTYAPNGLDLFCDHAYANVYTCGSDETGSMVWTVTADGHDMKMETVDVALTQDECHADTEFINVVLDVTE